MSADLTLVVYGTRGSVICRDVAVSSVVDLLTAVSSATRQLLALQYEDACSQVVVQPLSAKRALNTDDLLPVGDIEIINICGRVTHLHANGCVVHRECEPLLMLNRDSFGLRTGLFTIYGNFMTSESNKTTLFRGAKRCTDVLMITEHIFKRDCIESIIMHMLVAKARLPHAVVVQASQFERTLSLNAAWEVSQACASEDMTYMKPLHVDIKDNRKTSILLHIYSSGVVFFFVTCPDTQLSVAEESRVAAQCGEIYTCLASVC
jgi:hypothetical protein